MTKYNGNIYLKSFYVCISAILITIIIFLKTSYTDELSIVGVGTHERTLLLNGILGWIILALFLAAWKMLTGELFSLFTFFFVFFAFFNYGQSLIYVFVNDYVSDRSLYLYASEQQIIEAQYFTLLCMCTFCIGAVLAANPPPKIERNEYKEGAIINSLAFVGTLLFIFSFPAFLYDTYSTIMTVRSGGYLALYGYGDGAAAVSTVSKMLSFLASYFIPSLICLFAANKDYKARRYIILFTLLFCAFCDLYAGLRTSAMGILIIIMFLLHRLVKPINKLQFSVMVVGGYFLAVFLNVISDMRALSNRSIVMYLQQFLLSSTSESPIVKIVTELGWSMFPLTAVMNLFPVSYPFACGTTYLYAFTSIIPNIGIWSVHPATLYSDGPNWLMKALKMLYGPGFSVTAEAFRNFGWLGFIFITFLGLFFAKLYLIDNKSTPNSRPDMFVLLLIIFNSTATFARSDFMGFVRPTFFIAIPIYIFVRFYSRYLERIHI